jgi:serine protease Do
VTTIAVLGAAALFTGGSTAQFPTFPAAHAAENTQRPMGFADLAEKVKPAVVSVRVKMNTGSRMRDFEGNSPVPPNSQMDRFFRRFGEPEGINPDGNQRTPRNRLVTGQGSGFFISADGYAVTNNHVVDKADSVEITTDDGKTYTARVIGADQRTDVALIKVDARRDFPYVRLADKPPRIGDWVLAVGNPFGLGGTVTAGIVSARGRNIGAGPYDDYIQIDAAVNKGNSGGPTFDLDGNVIGVNTAIFSPSGGSVGIAFAIPASTVKSVVAQLRDKGNVSRGWIGVQIQPVTGEIAESLGLKTAEGALVSGPQASGPAAKAGIVAGDVITAVNGHSIKDPRELALQIGGMAPGSAVQLTVWRKGAEKTISLRLGELPNQRDARTTTPESNGREAPRFWRRNP